MKNALILRNEVLKDFILNTTFNLGVLIQTNLNLQLKLTPKILSYMVTTIITVIIITAVLVFNS